MIHVSDLSKVFRVVRDDGAGILKQLFAPDWVEVRAIDDISLSVEAGEAVGIVGPNGAGKSTLIKMLSGILVPTTGDLRVFDYIPSRDRISYTRHIGLVRGQASLLFWEIPVIESFKLFRDIYDLSENDYRRSLQNLCELLGIGDRLGLPPRKLSLGQRMRCEIAAALLHRPKLLFLDEPTIGLDVGTKADLLRYLKNLHRELGCTILMASHHLEEVDFLCERIVVVNKGRIVCDDSLAAVKAQIPRRLIRYRVKEIRETDAYRSFLAEHGAAETGDRVELEVRKEKAADVLREIMRMIDIDDLAVVEPSAEDAVVKYLL